MLAGEANGYNSFGNGHILASLRDAGDPIQIRDLLIHSGVDDHGIEAEIVLVPADRYEHANRLVGILYGCPKTVCS